MKLTDQYPWAINALKLERAVAYVKSIGPVTEEVVKARYIALGGIVKHIIQSDSPAESVQDSPTESALERCLVCNETDHSKAQTHPFARRSTPAVPAVETVETKPRRGRKKKEQE